MARWQIDPRVTARARELTQLDAEGFGDVLASARARDQLRGEFGITQTRATTALAQAARAIRRERRGQGETDHD